MSGYLHGYWFIARWLLLTTGVLFSFSCLYGSEYQINGTLKYYNQQLSGVDSTWVFLVQGGVRIDTTLTGNLGQFTFTDVENGVYTLEFSSLKVWGGINSADVLRIEQHTAKYTPFTEPVVLLAADVTHDGFVNGTDAHLLLRRTTGRITEFPGDDWVYTLAGTGGNSVTVSGSNVSITFYTLCTGDVNGSRYFGPPFYPCENTPTVTYAGKTYQTVRIGTQCWFRENLNVGTRINGIIGQNHANGIIEKYCYDDLDSNCDIYGGLYQWNEMMTCLISPNPSGKQGICPTGWHVPIHEEYCTLAHYLEATYNYCWDDWGWHGISVGGKLKEGGSLHWSNPNTGATDDSHFTALPAGFSEPSGQFSDLGSSALLWSSTSASDYSAFYRILIYNSAQIGHHDYYKNRGLSVRCIRDTCPPITISNAGPDQIHLTELEVQMAGNAPAVNEQGTWSVLSGNCGLFSNIHDPLATFAGKLGKTYSLRWTITNFCYDTIYDDVLISYDLPANSCPGVDSVVHAGNTYHTVQIGSQCWMRENIDIGTMIPSTQMPSNNGIIEKYCYQNNPVNCCLYGGFYIWTEAMGYAASSNSVPSGVQGICPPGWHIPSDNEWDTLTYYLGWATSNGGYLKETSSFFWSDPNLGANNETGFTGLGTGDRGWDGSFSALKERAQYWSSFDQWIRRLETTNNALKRSGPNSSAGYSVRCLKDPCGYVLPVTIANAGPDQLNLSCNRTVLSANIPAHTELGAWRVISGSGGTIDSVNNPHSLFTGASGQLYVLRWTVSNSCEGFSEDDVTISFTGYEGSPCTGIPAVSHGGQIYHTIQLGGRCWLKENLNVGTMIDSLQNQTNNSLIEKYCYRNDPDLCSVYGGLYQWDEMMQYSSSPGVRGICPTNWHLPTETEWNDMLLYSGGTTAAGGMLKSTCNDHWSVPNTGATNHYGFYALGSGLRSSSGPFSEMKESTRFWSSETSGTDAGYRQLTYNAVTVINGLASKQSGFAARCIYDCPAPTLASAGPDQLSIAGTVVTLAANTPPPGETGTWSILSGNSGSFENTISPTSSFSGKPSQNYTLLWTLSNGCGCAHFDTVIISFAAPANTCAGTPAVTYMGVTYNTVQIGTQCWMRENLNAGLIKSSYQAQTNNGIIEKYCYQDLPANCDFYGAFYLWDEMMNYSASSNSIPSGVQGICPPGWHIPSDAEWDVLTTFLGGSGIAGGKLKETTFANWFNPNAGASNETGFTALGTGDRGWDGSFSALKERTQIWSSYNQLIRRMASYNTILEQSPPNSSAGYSVRCLKD